MTSKIQADENEDEYDENSVFNRLFDGKDPAPRENSRRRLDRIFKTAKTPFEPIDVAEFLPTY